MFPIPLIPVIMQSFIIYTSSQSYYYTDTHKEIIDDAQFSEA
jgi:hypothetical protein